jgi:peptidoglycan/LPS O-acetylase OafA/YrhL
MDPVPSTAEVEKRRIKRGRIVFFDLLRIFFIALIVYGHYYFAFLPGINALLFRDGFIPGGIYPLGLNLIAVYGMICISGAVLEYQYPRIEGYLEYTKFIFLRFIRLYPAYWLSLLLAIMLPPWVYPHGLFSIFVEFTGFFFLLGMGPGYLNIMGWFIGTIFCLYLLFPLLSGIVKKYQLWSLFAFLLVSYASRSLLLTYAPGLNSYLLYRWLPITNLFEFCLGIYLVQKAIYPKNEEAYPVIQKLSEFSFYVFLFHIVVISAFVYDFGMNGPFINSYLQTMGNLTDDYVLTYSLWYLITMAMVLLVSWCSMVIDGKIQRAIFGNTRVRRFLAQY